MRRVGGDGDAELEPSETFQVFDLHLIQAQFLVGQRARFSGMQPIHGIQHVFLTDDERLRAQLATFAIGDEFEIELGNRHVAERGILFAGPL